MKRYFKLAVFLFLSFSLSGCQNLSRQNMYLLDDDNISFSLPKMWEQVESNDNDLALMKSEAELTMDIYHADDMDGKSAEELLKEKIKEEMSSMEEYKLIKKYNPDETPDRIIYSVLYKGTKDGMEKEYFLNVVEFKGYHTYVYAKYEAKEFYMKYNIDDIQRILVRMKWNGNKDLALQ